MYFHKYKNKDKPYFLYIHGEYLSAASFKEEAKELKKDFTLIIAEIDGHGKASEQDFTSIHTCVQAIYHYIQENCNGFIQVLSGFSLGAQIGVALLAQYPTICSYALIESARLQPTKLLHWTAYISQYANALTRLAWFHKFMYYTLFNDGHAFIEYHRNYRTLSKETIRNVNAAMRHYELNPAIAGTTCKLAILVGQRENKAYKISCDRLHDKVANAQIFMMMNYTHGDFSLGNPREYVRFIKSWVQKKDQQQQRRGKAKQKEREGEYMPNWKHLLNKLKKKKNSIHKQPE